jgi:hypothetical protein
MGFGASVATAELIAGPSGLVGFGILFFLRVHHEEELMIETFGEDYRRYMARTSRILPESIESKSIVWFVGRAAARLPKWPGLGLPNRLRLT